jgi:hypothetical protein
MASEQCRPPIRSTAAVAFLVVVALAMCGCSVATSARPPCAKWAPSYIRLIGDAGPNYEGWRSEAQLQLGNRELDPRWWELVNIVRTESTSADYLIVAERMEGRIHHYWYGVIVVHGDEIHCYRSGAFEMLLEQPHSQFLPIVETVSRRDFDEMLERFDRADGWTTGLRFHVERFIGTSEPCFMHIYRARDGACRDMVIDTPFTDTIEEDVVAGRSPLSSVPREALWLAEQPPGNSGQWSQAEYVDSYAARLLLNGVLRMAQGARAENRGMK